MAGRARGRRSTRNGPRNLVWSAVLEQNATVADAATLGDNIVTGSDWSAAGFERATLLSVRGYITVINTSASNNAIMMCIAKQGNSEPTISAAVVATYTAEDILWTGGVLCPAIAQDNTPHRFEINIKAKRKLTVGDDIAVFFAPVGGIARVQYVLRGLVDKG